MKRYIYLYILDKSSMASLRSLRVLGADGERLKKYSIFFNMFIFDANLKKTLSAVCRQLKYAKNHKNI